MDTARIDTARIGNAGIDTADRAAAGNPENVHVPDDQRPRAEPSASKTSRVELLADLDRPGAWMLLVGGVPQSHVDLDDPRHLEFEYIRRLGHVIDLSAQDGEPLRVLHLGAGALTLARYVAATRPGSRQLAVESDPEVADLVARRLPVGRPRRPPAGRIKVRVDDARSVLMQTRDAAFDVVIADAFDGGQTPAHLTSVEFTSAVARVLAPAGVFAANIGDGPPLAHARGRVAAVSAVFGQVAMVAEAAVLRGRRFGNLLVVATNRQLDVTGLVRSLAADPFPARVVTGGPLRDFLGGARPITDATARPSPLPPPGAFA
jgi:spermidine synthase